MVRTSCLPEVLMARPEFVGRKPSTTKPLLISLSHLDLNAFDGLFDGSG